jgi:SEC-C motif-containing protein
MRSRYTAYKTGHVAHIIATTHPESPHFQDNPTQWAEDIQSFCDTTRFERLEVQSARSEVDQGWVQFVAHLHQGGQAVPMQEHSEFRKVEGRWLYLCGVESLPSENHPHS